MSLIDRALEYAKICHDGTNHLYDGQPYMVHLRKVVHYANKYSVMYLQEKDIEVISAACLCHDVIEDCRQTFNDVKKALSNEHVAQIVYAVTNEKGKTRAERANVKYYQGIRAVPGATFVKLCDRLANVSYSQHNNTDMLQIYREENDFMYSQLFKGDYVEMWNELHKLLYEKE